MMVKLHGAENAQPRKDWAHIPSLILVGIGCTNKQDAADCRYQFLQPQITEDG